MNYSDQQIESLFKDVWTGKVNPSEYLPEDLYFSIADFLERGLFDGFGGSIFDFGLNEPDGQLLAELRENIYMFSGAKTYQQCRQMAELAGSTRTFSEFRTEASKVFRQYNEDWLKAEHTTCVGQAQQAAQWSEIQKSKDLFPWLRYVAVMDKNTSDICRPLNGIIRKVDDPLWNKYSPLNHFNCRCVLEKLDKYEDVTETPDAKVGSVTKELNDTVQAEFKMNPGKDGYIFSPKHPYFEVAPKDKPFAKRNFDLPIPEAKAKPLPEPKPAKEEPKVEGFVPAKTLKEAENYAKKVLGCEYANFKGVHIDVANDMNRGLYETKVLMPNLQVGGIGSAQAANLAIKKEIFDAYKRSDLYTKIEKAFGSERADAYAKGVANQHAQRVGTNTIAWSTNKNTVTIGDQVVDLRKYRGVYVNDKYGKSKEAVDNTVRRNSENGWFAKGGKDFSYIMNHELGHEVDKFLLIRDDPAFMEIYNRERNLGTQSVSDKLSKYAATAGGQRSHLRHEMIAEAWAEFTTSESPRELSKEIGTMMLKKYHESHIKNLSFEEWEKTILKTIKKKEE